MTNRQHTTSRDDTDLILDQAGLHAYVQRDPEFLSELLVAFDAYRPVIVERIENAVRNHDPAELREAAHQLKGSLGNFHARAAVTTARQIELAAKNGTLQDAEALCKRLNDELDLLCAMVERIMQELQESI